ncbi:hypothetical protein RSSM_05053 [Rhodopirellula sallentina SM41]|uniref:Uncharacterized protein n=1 Tax=Rhodopirellula sallentina SM41 TaxID=1263870 RepID=M5TWT2_9BACT|nr:hypothetical protein RSSM_05053 [Rhodopirellula sallentina SM41]
MFVCPRECTNRSAATNEVWVKSVLLFGAGRASGRILADIVFHANDLDTIKRYENKISASVRNRTGWVTGSIRE